MLNALSSGRLSATADHGWVGIRNAVIKELNRVLSLCSTADRNDSRTIRQLCEGMVVYFESGSVTSASDVFDRNYPEASVAVLKNSFNSVKDISREGIRSEGGQYESYAPIDAHKRQRIETIVRPYLGVLSRVPEGISGLSLSSADCPTYFGKQSFRYEHLENALSRDELNSGRARDNCSTMLMRIYRLLEDSRFEFLFGPHHSEWPSVQHSMATFLRDILGLESCSEVDLSNTDTLAEGILPFYDRQRTGAEAANVVIVDLSLLASEVLENVTALIGRLIHEFLQRLSDPASGIARGEFPVALILEEAQNYIREGRKSEEDSISKEVFERIAREGRKYGLGLVVASQRPSELSKTVLSQCNSFIVHRLQNPEDLRYFREIVPGIYGQLLDQLPALAPRSALVLGECVQAPALVEMREVDPAPRSKNPQFFRSWTGVALKPNVEAVCAKWEGVNAADGEIVEIEENGQ